MATELAKIQSYVPQIVLDKLGEYRQIHNLQSTSQAIAVALTEFFNIEIIRPNLISTDNSTIYHRIEQVETSVNCLMQRLSVLEQNYAVLLQLAECAAKPLIEPLQSLEPTSSASSTECVEEKNIFLGNSNIDTAQQEDISFRSRASSSLDSSNNESTTLASEEWKTGVTTNALVARLKTNPTTLKKYLRDLKQVQWAAQRDPQHIGWIYDPLLERYFPVQFSLRTIFVETSEPSNSDKKEHQRQNHTNEAEKLESTQESKIQLRQKGGLSQSQLSRLTGISANTLQRWKHLSECSELIRCRTDGEFVYWYSKQNKRFYEINSSLPCHPSTDCST